MEPIGFVRTEVEKVPRNFRVSEVEGTLKIEEAYAEGLADIEPGQRIVVIFNFHESPAFSSHLLRQTPPTAVGSPHAQMEAWASSASALP
jgi:tRNA (Thr-GGU) A37 N-methylase